MSELNLTGETDARKWELAFHNARAARFLVDGVDIADDEATMIGWFANAIESGRMAGEKPSQKYDLLVQLGKLSDAEAREVGMRISQAINRYRKHQGMRPV